MFLTATKQHLPPYESEYDYADRNMLRIKYMLSGFFKFLIEHQVIEKSPVEKITFNRYKYKKKAILFKEEQIDELIKLAKSHSPALFYPVFLLLKETAAKREDLIELQWKDVNFKKNTISFFRSKNIQPRSFDISEELLSALKIIDPISNYVFTGIDGRPFRQYILARELKRFQRHLSLDTKWSLQDLRTSYAANFLNNGGTIKELQKLMGHNRPYHTEESYGRYQVVDSRKIYGELT